MAPLQGIFFAKSGVITTGGAGIAFAILLPFGVCTPSTVAAGMSSYEKIQFLNIT